jgi:hypothetical protein
MVHYHNCLSGNYLSSCFCWKHTMFRRLDSFSVFRFSWAQSIESVPISGHQHQIKVKVILRPTVSWPVRLGVRHPSGTRDQFFLLLEIFFRQLRVCYFVAPSLMRGRVCNLLLLLVLASAVPLGSESRGTQDHIVLPQFLKLPQSGGPGPRIYIPQEQRGPDIPPGIEFPFRRFLQLVGLRWRYSIPPTHGKESIYRSTTAQTIC